MARRGDGIYQRARTEGFDTSPSREENPMKRDPMLRRVRPLALALVLAGCASSSKTYGPDGREAYTLNCSGLARSWTMCAEKAGEICGTRGYDVVGAAGGSTGGMATVSRSGGFAGSGFERSMLIQCKQ